MSTFDARRDNGGRIDREKVLRFTFDGRDYTGYEGDTLASALIANGVMLTARSFRYRRPRGIFSAGAEECHAIVSVGSGASLTPNVRATVQPLYDGLVAHSQRDWPTLKWDLGALNGWFSRFLPVGFYYKTFIWPRWSWYETFIRRAAGGARAPREADPDRYEKRNAHCDLLVIGAGPTGLTVALAAARSGLRIIVVDDQTEAGGSLLWSDALIERRQGTYWARKMVQRLAAEEHITVLHRTSVAAAWDHGYFTAVQDTGGSQPAQVLWKIRSRHTILAGGAIEQPMVFTDNDRPGIMLADSARQYVNRYAARPGSSAVFFTNNDSAYRAAIDLQESGVRVKAIADTRTTPPAKAARRARERGIDVLAGHEVAATRGYWRLKEVTLRPIDTNRGAASGPVRVSTDLLCVSGGWNPTLHLYSQAGGELRYDEKTASFIPAHIDPGRGCTVFPAGAANGAFELSACLLEGHEAGLDAVERLTGTRPEGTLAPSTTHEEPYSIQPGATGAPASKGRQWIDYLHDVTRDSITVAAREGYRSVEHLKRYTTTSMSLDQGKTANPNAIAALAEASDRSPGAVGTTRFRPPFQPVTLGALAGRETGSRAWPTRRLPLHDWHVQSGGVMEDHSGWLRAAYYPREGENEEQSIRREALAARNAAALFDSSSLGKIEVRGPDAARFLNRIYINNVETLKTGRVRYGMMLDENGVIVDDGVFARLEDDLFLVSASSAGTADVVIALEEWLQTEWTDLDVLVHNATTQWATLTVSGPCARKVLSSVLPNEDLSAETFPHMSVRTGVHENMAYRLMRVSFTGETSFELGVPAGDARSTWQRLLDAGAAFGITPLGMEALDVLRTEKGYLEVGVDTDISTNPLDVGWAVPISKKQADFIGKRSLERKNDLRTDRLQLVGLEPRDRNGFVPVGSQIVDTQRAQAEGHVTSSCISPTLERSICMAMLKSGHARLGEEVIIDVEGRQAAAKVVPLTFFDPEGVRLNA
ncbi:MAG: sarcosine oxidase subunit alpha family protein [Xanthomonadales bacterium]|jgi:sarcosine oxidase subunit alpha|nr:sarcosine oxidase subunit alpha family protein [Xanthomonadales bacterium]